MGMHRNFKTSPGAIRLGFLNPKPTHLQGLSHCFKVDNAQPSQLKWSHNFLPSHQATATINLFSPFPQEASSDLVNCSDKPFRDFESNQQVNWDCSEHKANQHRPTSKVQKRGFPTWQLISNFFNPNQQITSS